MLTDPTLSQYPKVMSYSKNVICVPVCYAKQLFLSSYGDAQRRQYYGLTVKGADNMRIAGTQSLRATCSLKCWQTNLPPSTKKRRVSDPYPFLY
eukprot:gene41-22_t